ncbi:MAG: hypothetical protein M3033_19415 [Acidobacteriota bacterium]|nr:hypothetical protein [Acidobacteriota bacterium]
MKNVSFKSFLVVLFFCSFAFGQQNESIPKSAMILETQAVTPNRKMVLWMLNPLKHPYENQESDFYACPDETRGSYYKGVAHVSLIDTTTDKLINTVEVKYDDNDKSPDEIDIPYAIRGGYYYTVSDSDKKKESKPRIMEMKDYNGDGKALEFALFDKEACQGLSTTLIGYSEKQDKVVQYPIKLKTGDKTETVYWIDLLFLEKPVQNGFWKYQIDYRGRGGSLDKYEIRYDKEGESFGGILTSETPKND